MQQFWYTIKKVQGTYSYEFLLSNKKCRVDTEVFRKILNICPRLEGEEFNELQNDDDTITFLVDLAYKGPLHKYTNMYVDHMSQPWRTLAAIINKCISGKTDDNIVSRLKFVRVGEDYQEYGLAIPKVMLNDAIKQLESYQMFIKYSTESEPEPVKKKTASRRVVKKKVIISADDNIIPDLDVALELGRSMSSAEAEEEEAAKQALKERKKTNKRNPGTGV
ncbi:hypothetical protein Tco_1154980 [Tanacetum coccineum]